MRIKKDHLYSLLARLNYQLRFRYGLNKDINGWQLYQESVHGNENNKKIYFVVLNGLSVFYCEISA